MKTFVKIIMVVLFSGFVYGDIQAQKKKVTKRSTSSKTGTVKFTPREFATPDSSFVITDVPDSSSAYSSVNNLVQTNGVTLAYADSTFRPKDPLRRGDFIVSFNSALEAIKRAGDSGSLDSAVVNTYDRNQSYITSVSEITDVKEGSVYYPAVQSLIERWGIAAPFTKSKLLNASAPMLETEVYDILRVTLGYTSPGSNPYAKAMTRGKFAMVLNNALNQKLAQVNELASARMDSVDNQRRQEEMGIQQQERMRRDSLTKEVELSKIEAQRKEAEAWSKLSEREKRKQARINVKEQK
jgi:hypothetical protein